MNSMILVNENLSYDLEKSISLDCYEGQFEGKRVAIKRKHIGEPFNAAQIGNLVEIANIHPSIIGYFGTFSDIVYNYMVIESHIINLEDFMKKEDDFVNHIRGKVVQKDLLFQISEGIKFLHDKDIAIQELKPDGILIGNDFKAKISKFEDAKVVTDEEKITSFPADIKKLGQIFLFVLTRNQTLKIFQENAQTFPIENHELALNLVTSMVHDCPASRVSIAQIIKHPYFWTCGIRLSFIGDIKQFLNQNSEDTKWLEAAINNTARFFEMDWTKNLNKKIMTDVIKQFKDHNKEKITDLLGYIRYKWVHSVEWSSSMKKIFGDSDLTYFNYWNNQFPKLMLHVYEVIRELYREKEPFLKYFPVTQRIPRQAFAYQSPHFKDGFLYPRLRVLISKKRMIKA